MSVRTGIPLLKKVPRSLQARSATLIDKHSTEHNSRIFEVRNNPIVLTAFGLRESDSIIVESAVRVGGIDYFQPYLKDGIDIRLYSGRTSAVLAVAGRYRVVLSGDLGEVVCTYTIQRADLGRDVGMPSGAQANRPNLFLGDPGDGSLSNIIEIQDRPWTFFAYNLGEADAIQVLQVFGEGPSYREEVYSPESGEGALHLTVARNSITLDRSGRFRFRLQGTTPGVVLVGNPTTPQTTVSTGSSGGGGGTVTRVDVSAGAGLVASGGPITTVGTIQIDLSDGTKLSLERADSAVQPGSLAAVATSGDYKDLSNLPTIPEQVNLIAGDNVDITGTYPDLTINAESGGAGGQVDAVTAGTGIDVDSTDPANPEISINEAVQVSLDRADSAVQPGNLAAVATSGSYDDLGDLPVIPEQVNLTAGNNITLTGDYPNIEIAAQAGGGGGGQVDSVVAGTGVSVDAADPENPEVALSPASVDSLGKADTAVQPESLAQVATTGEYDDLNNPPNIPEQINLTAGDNITLTGDYPNIEVSAEAAGGQVDSITGGPGIEVGSSDPANPSVGLSEPTIESLSLADSSLQEGDTIQWEWLQNIPAFAERWPAWGEVTGLSEELSKYATQEYSIGLANAALSSAVNYASEGDIALDEAKLNTPIGTADGSTVVRGDGVYADTILGDFGFGGSQTRYGGVGWGTCVAVADFSGLTAAIELVSAANISPGLSTAIAGISTANNSGYEQLARIQFMLSGGVEGQHGGGIALTTRQAGTTGSPTTRFGITDQGNIHWGSGPNAVVFGEATYGGGVGVARVVDAGTAPTSNTTGGGLFYAFGGGGYWRTQSGNEVNFAPNVRPVVSGSRGGNAALASLITALEELGFVEDGTTE